MKHRLNTLPTIVFAMLSFPALGCKLAISDAWIREAPAGSKTLAGYVQLANKGADAVTLVEVSSPQIRKIELHEMIERDGMMRMRPLGDVAVAAGEVLSLQPGGKHLMLFDPKQELRAGASIEMNFKLACGITQQVQAEVRKPKP